MRKLALYLFAAFLLTSCDNLKTKGANSEDDTEETVKKKKKAIVEDENTDEENTEEEDTPKRKKKLTDDETEYTSNDEEEESSDSKGWSKADQKDFLNECVDKASANLGEEKAKDYCSCMMGKIQKRYPDSKDVTQMGEDEMTRMAKNCIN